MNKSGFFFLKQKIPQQPTNQYAETGKWNPDNRNLKVKPEQVFEKPRTGYMEAVW